MCEGTVYYVSPTEGCATKYCHTLSYYIQNDNFPENITFVFLEGEHLLYGKNHLEIRQSKRAILKGQGQWVHGYHWSIMQPKTVIRCKESNTSTAISLSNIAVLVYIEGVTIANCGMGLNISSCPHVALHQVSIQNNTYTGCIIRQMTNGTINITNSAFVNNGIMLAIPDSSSVYGNLQILTTSSSSSTYISKSNISFGRSPSVGGLNYFYQINLVNGQHQLQIDHCLFYKNRGSTSGGFSFSLENYVGSLIILHLSMSNTKFLANMYGGVYLLTNAQSNIVIEKCHFDNNIGNDNGGAYLVFDGSRISTLLVKDSTFNNNIGSFGIGLQLLQISFCISKFENVTIDSNILASHPSLRDPCAFCITCKCSQFFPFHISFANVEIRNHNFSGLFLDNCHLHFITSTIIANNHSPFNGGGITLGDESVLWSDNTSSVSFINNSAHYRGGAIFSMAKVQNIHNIGSCTFIDLKASFSGNSAGLSGNSIYGGSYYDCYHITNTAINTGDPFSFLFMLNCSTFTTKSGVSSDPIGVCVCSDDKSTVDCFNRSSYRQVYPGESISLSLVTVGICGGVSPGTLITTSKGLNVTLGQSSQETHAFCRRFQYLLKQTGGNNNSQISISNSGGINMPDASFIVNVTFLQCPIGLQLDSVMGICVCNKNILQSIDKCQCDISWMPYPIRRYGNKWLSYNTWYNCVVAHRHCPFDYCNTSMVSFHLEESDLQCLHKRSGILCGQCQEGLIVLYWVQTVVGCALISICC